MVPAIPRRPGGRARLVCLPHAGGSATAFRQLSEDLCDTVDVWSVQYPGRQDRRREEPIEDIPALAEQISEVVGTLGDRPLALFGHSMGAIVAFEVARRLDRTAGAPVALFVSVRRGPSVLRDDGVHRLDDAGLIAEIRSLDGTDGRLFADDEVVQMVLPAIRADYRAVGTYEYRPGPLLGAPIVALVGQDDPRASREEVAAWAEQTAADFSVHVLPGGHFYLNESGREASRIVADSLTRILARPQSAAS